MPGSGHGASHPAGSGGQVLVAFALVLALAGCGGEDRDAPPAPEDVIRAWTDDLRRGDVDAATDRFAVPAIVANGTPRITLRTRAEVRFFNDTLPCGGRLLRTERQGRLIVGTFELTERPGGNCGSGTGHVASTAFEIRDGKIVRWLRVIRRRPPDARRV